MIDQTFPAESTPRVEVRIQSGEVRFLPGEPGEVRVVADAKSQTGLEVTRRGATVLVKTNKGGWLRNDDAHISIYAPETTEVLISTASANVKTTTPLARLEINTASGDVSFDTVADLEVRTASGDIRGEKVSESANIVGASGDVRISSCLGKASLSSASGDIDIDLCQGPMKTATASGDVSVTNCRSPEVSCKSMSGSVTLGVPPRTRVSLDANTLSGQVNLPEPSQSEETPEAKMSIKVRLVSGDLNLFRAI